jgi:hypothetical protein
MINLATAATLTLWSKRTIWRRISDGTLARTGGDDVLDDKKTKIQLETIKSYICVPMDMSDYELVEQADAGCPEAQSDLALLFMSHDKMESAVYWLELAAKQNYTGAMHLLGRYYIDGKGGQKNENVGMMWIAKAAAMGHVLSQELMHAVFRKLAL